MACQDLLIPPTSLFALSVLAKSVQTRVKLTLDVEDTMFIRDAQQDIIDLRMPEQVHTYAL